MGIFEVWQGVGVTVFMISLMVLAFIFLERFLYYGAVLVRGWPERYMKRGHLTVNCGRHEIEIDTDVKPTEVWISFDDERGDIPVCQGSVDTVGVSVTRDGFILNLNIQSTKRRLRWIAEF